MRPRIRIFCLFLALCLTLAGCAAPAEVPLPDTPEPESPTQEEPVQSDPHALGLAYDPGAGLNPYDCVSLTNRVLLPLIYEGLFRTDETFSAVPVLCQSYTVSDGGKTFSFQLRQGIRFQNGKALTAADAVYSLRQAMGSDYYGSRFYRVASVSAADSTTVVVTLTTPVESLPVLLNVPIIPENADAAANPSGTGPYRLSGGALTRNDSWWNGDGTFPWEQITLVEASSSAEVRDQFEYGKVDLVCADPTSDAAATYHSDYELWSCPTTVLQFLGFNRGRAPFDNEALRAAITYAVDRESIAAQLCGGFAEAAVLPVSSACASYDSRLAAQYSYDPEAFRQAISAAGGYAQEATLLVCSDSAQRVAAANQIADTLNSFGFLITVRSLPLSQYKQELLGGNFDLYYGEVRLSANFDLTPFFAANGSACFGSMADGAAQTLCQYALENSGNNYDLYRQVLQRGLLCPVLLKTYAVYATRGAFSQLFPSQGQILCLTPPEIQDAAAPINQ